MARLSILLGLTAALAACGGGSEPQSDHQDPPPSVVLEAPTAVRGTHRVKLQWQGAQAGQTISVWLAGDDTEAFRPIATGLANSPAEVDLGATWKLDWPQARLRVRACGSATPCSDSNVQVLTDALVDSVATRQPLQQKLPSIFGYRVALSGDGNALAVADPADFPSTGPRPPGIGSITMFRRCGNGCWRREATVTNYDVAGNFGDPMALSGDGRTLVVGAYTDGDDGNIGAAYVFVREGDQVWRQQAVLRATEPRHEFFGRRVVIDATGDRIIAAASRRLHVFARDSSGTWQPDGVLEEPASVADLSPSTALALSGNGLVLASFAWAAVPPLSGEQPHTVRVYARGPAGLWTLQADLRSGKPPPRTGPTDSRPDNFGEALSLNHGGTTLAAGARFDNGDARDTSADPDNFGAIRSGAVHIFGRTNGAWQRRAFVKARGAPAGDEFGTDIALSGDGRVLLGKACGYAGNAAGVHRNHRAGTVIAIQPGGNTAYCDSGGSGYVLTQDDAGRWTHTASVIPVGDELVAFDFFSIALSADASTLAFGASSNAAGLNRDRVFVY